MLAVAGLLATLSGPAAQAQTAPMRDTSQMSPSGYTGAINTPTADVLPMGSATLALTNSIPEQARRFPGVGGFGGLNLGFGLFPGLELVGRLAFDGDLQCNLYSGAACKGATRDLSVGGKYQLPLTLPFNTRLAVGTTDYGGAATNYRQAYGVATSTLGPVDVSLGYSKGSSRTPLMDGMFGSVVARVTDQLAVAAEHDTQAKRLGVHYTQPINQQTDVQLGFSRKLSGPAAQQANQLTVALHYFFEKDGRQRRTGGTPAWGVDAPAANAATAAAAAAAVVATPDVRAQQLAERLAGNGFADIDVSLLPAKDGQAALWWVRAEPVGWRKNRHDALAAALVQWMHGTEAADTEVMVTLTYMGVPTGGVHTSRTCLSQFASGADQCGSSGQALRFFHGNGLPERLQTAETPMHMVSGARPMGWMPQVELGVSLRTTVGTEYGLTDYSAAVDAGMQLQLAKGLMWQGNVLLPVARSEDFDKGGVFHQLGHTKAEVDQALLSYTTVLNTPVARNVAVQASVGAVNAYSAGGQLDAVWLNPNGDWRVGGTVGAYNRKRSTGQNTNETPALMSVRHSVLAGQWQLEGTAGKFLGGDTGYQLSSKHWFGDYGLHFYVRESKGNRASMPTRRFAGFEISLPFGPATSYAVGNGATVRGLDRWAWGLRTKIGDTNNNLTAGYGEIPRPRHGVWTDFTDHDRSGPVDMWGSRQRLRASLQGAAD
jgi:hypothetical protein